MDSWCLTRTGNKSMLCRKSCVFSGYSGFHPRGNLAGWVKLYGPTVFGICCDDPAIVVKVNK